MGGKKCGILNLNAEQRWKTDGNGGAHQVRGQAARCDRCDVREGLGGPPSRGEADGPLPLVQGVVRPLRVATGDEGALPQSHPVKYLPVEVGLRADLTPPPQMSIPPEGVTVLP